MRPRQFTDQDLLETARQCFLEHGPGCSTATIAEALGVSQSALFKRVGTKAELLRRAMLEPLLPTWIGRVERPPDDRPVPEQLLSLAREIDEFFGQLVVAINVVRASGMDHAEIFAQFDEPPPVRAHRALSGWFRALADGGRAAIDDPEAVALAFLAGLQFRHGLRHLLGDELAPDGGPNYLQTLVDMTWSGIRPRTEEAR